jgi:hypothetical protein
MTDRERANFTNAPPPIDRSAPPQSGSSPPQIPAASQQIFLLGPSVGHTTGPGMSQPFPAGRKPEGKKKKGLMSWLFGSNDEDPDEARCVFVCMYVFLCVCGC